MAITANANTGRIKKPVKQSCTVPAWLDEELWNERLRTGRSKQQIIEEQIAARYPEARRRNEGNSPA